MDYKKTNAPTSIITRDTGVLESKTGNLYETIVVASKRANQIGVDIKNELNKKLEEFASYTDNLEEIFENREQIEISKFYERLPKPVLLALQEMMEDKIYFRIPSEEELEQERIDEEARAEVEANIKIVKEPENTEQSKTFDELIAEATDTPSGNPEAEMDKKVDKPKKTKEPKTKKADKK